MIAGPRFLSVATTTKRSSFRDAFECLPLWSGEVTTSWRIVGLDL